MALTKIPGALNPNNVLSKSADYTMTTADDVVVCSAGVATITLPTAASMSGREIIIINTSSSSITVDGNGTETIDGALTRTIAATTSAYSYGAMRLLSNGTNWRTIGGNQGFSAYTTKTVGTIYQAECDGFVVCYYQGSSTAIGQSRLEGYTDTAASPTTLRTACFLTSHTSANGASGQYTGLTMMVRAGDYYKTVDTTISGSVTRTAVMVWLPFTF